LASKAAEFNKIVQNNGHYAVQGHSRSPILVPVRFPISDLRSHQLPQETQVFSVSSS